MDGLSALLARSSSTSSQPDDAPRRTSSLNPPIGSSSAHQMQPFAADGRAAYGLPSLPRRSTHSPNEAAMTGYEHGDAGTATKKSDEKDAAPAPAWTEMKTKAGKERKRLPLACIACRRKKIRCSGEKPACKHCVRSRIPCVYKVTTRKAAPRTDYMAMLEKRLRRMEERVIRVIPKDAQAAVVGNARAVVKPALPGAPSRTTKDAAKRSAEEAFGGDVDKWAGSKVLHEEAGKATLQQQQGDSEEQSLLDAGADSLPEPELQEHLAEVFFDYVYGQAYFLLHKPSFMRKLKAKQLPPVLILSMCAMAARFSTHPAVRTEPAFLRGEQWAAVARDIALKRYDKPNITILICYVILSLHEFGTCQGGRSWMFAGMSQRMAYALQLHKELEHENWGKDQPSQPQKPRLSPTDQEIRRRTMWSCYMMDRFTSSGTDRPLFLWEKNIKVRLPVKESFFQMEVSAPTEDMQGNVQDPAIKDDEGKKVAQENTGLPGYTIRAAAIWGHILDYMNFGGRETDEHPLWDERSGFQGLLREATDFKNSIPPWFAYTPENLQVHSAEKTANQFIFLHIFAHQNVLFLNRFALPSAAKDAHASSQDFLASTTRAALEAANQVSTLLVDAIDHRVVAPFAGYCAFLSSTVHIQGIFSKNARLEGTAKKNLAINVKYLSKIKRYWGMFHFVTEQLKDQYREQADTSASGNGRKGSDIFQYGDWFDRYPSGVSSTDFEDPAAEVKKEPGTDAVMSQKSEVQSMEDFLATLSPASKQAHLHKATAKKRRQTKSRSEPKSATSAGRNDGNAFAQAQPTGDQQPNLSLSAADNVYPLTPDHFTPTFSDMPNVDWAALAQQTNFYPEAPHMIDALDRQLVMSSLTGFDSLPAGFTPPAQQAAFNTQQSGLPTSQPQQQGQQNRSSATEALVQAQMRAQAQVQAQARLQQQQQQQRQHQQPPHQPQSGAATADWSSWDLSMDAQPSFDTSTNPNIPGFDNSAMDWSGASGPGTAWFMPFNLQMPASEFFSGGGAGPHAGWDDVFASGDLGLAASRSNSGAAGGGDGDEDVGGLNSAFGALSEIPGPGAG